MGGEAQLAMALVLLVIFPLLFFVAHYFFTECGKDRKGQWEPSVIPSKPVKKVPAGEKSSPANGANESTCGSDEVSCNITLESDPLLTRLASPPYRAGPPIYEASYKPPISGVQWKVYNGWIPSHQADCGPSAVSLLQPEPENQSLSTSSGADLYPRRPPPSEGFSSTEVPQPVVVQSPPTTAPRILEPLLKNHQNHGIRTGGLRAGQLLPGYVWKLAGRNVLLTWIS